MRQCDHRLHQHRHLRPHADRQGVRGAERGRVREREVEVVRIRRHPALRDEFGCGVLREREAHPSRGAGGALLRSSPIELPVPEAEHDDVRHPDQRSPTEQRRGVDAVHARDDVVHQQDGAERVGDGHDADQRDRAGPKRRGTPVDPARVADDDDHQQDDLQHREQPPTGHSPTMGHDHLEGRRHQYGERHRPSALSRELDGREPPRSILVRRHRFTHVIRPSSVTFAMLSRPPCRETDRAEPVASADGAV